MKREIKYSLFSFTLLVLMVPALVGVHVFNHYCNACLSTDVSASIIAAHDHSHNHECGACTCDEHCASCHDEYGHHKHHGEDADNCKHEYLLFEYMGNLEVRTVNLKVVDFDLPYSTVSSENIQLNFNKTVESYVTHAILHIPDEPSPQQNCVFLL